MKSEHYYRVCFFGHVAEKQCFDEMAKPTFDWLILKKYFAKNNEIRHCKLHAQFTDNMSQIIFETHKHRELRAPLGLL